MEQTLEGLAGALARGRRLMGLDLGTETIGVAVSDASLSIASPVTTIRRTRFKRDAEQLAALVEERQAGGLVYGLPVNMDGTEGPRCQSTRGTQTVLPDWKQRMAMGVTSTSVGNGM